MGKVAKHRCSHCDAELAGRSSLEQHIKTRHLKLKPHVCKWCSKTFAERIALVRHERVHTNERPYACSECDARFKVASNLIDHRENKHKNARAFACRECEFRCNIASKLERHIMSRHRVYKMYFCVRGCGRKFARLDDLQRHLKARKRPCKPESSLTEGDTEVKNQVADSRPETVADKQLAIRHFRFGDMTVVQGTKI